MVYLYCYSIYILLTQEPIKFDGLLVDNKIIFFTFFEKENHFIFSFFTVAAQIWPFFFFFRKNATTIPHFVRMRQSYPTSLHRKPHRGLHE